MKSFENKVVVISGAGSGIGRALALEFAGQGARLAINDIHAGQLEESRQLIEETTPCYSLVVDTAQRGQVYAFAEKVVQTYGQVDVVINNAGVGLGAVAVEELEYADFEWVMNINLWGMIYGTKAFLPHLKSRPEASVVNLSSILGILGVSYQAAYCTSKFAIRGFTESLRMEMRAEAPQVVVSSVHPGGINTNIARASRMADKQMDEATHRALTESFQKTFITSPEKAARTIMRGIRRKKERILIGPDARLLALVARLFPASYHKILMRQFAKSGLDQYIRIRRAKNQS